jgi:GAF domain-containing protein
MAPVRHFEENDERRRYETLLEMADLAVRSHSLPELLPELALRLHKVASFDVANFSVYDPGRDLMRMHFWEGKQLHANLAELPLHESACGLALQQQQAVVWHDLTQETRFERTVRLLKDKGVRSYIAVPLTKAEQRLGALGLGSAQVGLYTNTDVKLISQVAELVAGVLENAMTRAAFRQEKERLEVLLRVSTTLAATLDVQGVFL